MPFTRTGPNGCLPAFMPVIADWTADRRGIHVNAATEKPTLADARIEAALGCPDYVNWLPADTSPSPIHHRFSSPILSPRKSARLTATGISDASKWFFGRSIGFRGAPDRGAVAHRHRAPRRPRLRQTSSQSQTRRTMRSRSRPFSPRPP